MSDNILYILIAGMIQGLTEFLPISSSGHLIILKDIFGQEINNFDFEIMLHLGTVFSIIFYYKKDILELLNPSHENKNNVFLILVGCIPISVIGLLSKDLIELYFNDIYLLPYPFFITAIFLFFTKYFYGDKNLNFKIVFIVSFFQIFALFPGISRSGITISTLLILGVNQKDAIRFSFLMAIPLILGASLLGIDLENITYLHVFGIITSFIFG